MSMQSAATQSLDKLHIALSAKLSAQLANEFLNHYELLRVEYRLDHYDLCLVNGEKFVEDTFRCLSLTGDTQAVDLVSLDETFKNLDAKFLNNLEDLRMLRILQLMRELCKKHGGLHNSSLETVKMDCALVVTASNWVIAEMARLYLTDEMVARTLIKNLLVGDILLVEEIEGDLIVYNTALSARIHLLLLLRREYPTFYSLKNLLMQCPHKPDNVRVTLRGMKQKNIVHETQDGWILTEAGVQEAETEIVRLLLDNSDKSTNIGKLKGARHGRK